MTTQWNIAQPSIEDQALAQELCQSLELSPVLGRLLVGRGVRSLEEARAFLEPTLESLHNPYLIEDMEVAVRRLSQAIEGCERILIYGDYDVDGTTAVSLVYTALRDHLCPADRLCYYIPDRYDEGYGISMQSIDYAHRWGAGLIIALDCGIKAHEQIAYARSLGIDFIICDHHQPDEALPDAVAILDPKRPGNLYPNEELSGCGVGFKLMQAMLSTWGHPENTVYEYLDLVAVSIAADIVPVVGENRVLAYHGLKKLNSSPSLGLKEIIRTCNLEGEIIDMNSIVFKIGPRINASGRMMSGTVAVDLLTADNVTKAQQCSALLDQYNNQRRELDQIVTQQAIDLIKREGGLANRRILILYQPDWHKGVLGIVASRLTERYNRPTIILTQSADDLVGSGRSMRSVDLYSALEACREYLVNFGGHTHAAGITIREENLDAFRLAMEAYFERNVEPVHLTKQIQVDIELKIEDVQPTLLDDIRRLSPFGLQNEPPTFVTHRLRDAGGSRVVGRDSRHIKLRMTDRYCKNRPLHGIALGQARHASWIMNQQAFGICYTIEDNRFYGSGFMQLQVKDIHTTEKD